MTFLYRATRRKVPLFYIEPLKIQFNHYNLNFRFKHILLAVAISCVRYLRLLTKCSSVWKRNILCKCLEKLLLNNFHMNVRRRLLILKSFIYFTKLGRNILITQACLSYLFLPIHRLALEASHAKAIVLYQGLWKC